MLVICLVYFFSYRASLRAQLVMNPPTCRRPQFNSWVRKVLWRRDRLPTPVFLGFPCGSDDKEFACNAEDLDWIPGLRLTNLRECIQLKVVIWCSVPKLCPTLCDPMDLEFSRNSPGQNTGVHSLSLLLGSSQPRDQTQVSRIAVDSLPVEPQGKPKNTGVDIQSLL